MIGLQTIQFNHYHMTFEGRGPDRFYIFDIHVINGMGGVMDETVGGLMRREISGEAFAKVIASLFADYDSD